MNLYPAYYLIVYERAIIDLVVLSVIKITDT